MRWCMDVPASFNVFECPWEKSGAVSDLSCDDNGFVTEMCVFVDDLRWFNLFICIFVVEMCLANIWVDLLQQKLVYLSI